VWQGCVLAPVLLSIATDWILNYVNAKWGINVGNRVYSILSMLTIPYSLYNPSQMQLNVLTGTRHTADAVSNLSDDFFPLRTCASVLLQSAAVRFSTTSGIPNFSGPEFTSFPNFMTMHPQLTFKLTNRQTDKRMMEVIKYSYVLQKLTFNICWQLEIQITTTHNLLASHSLS